MFSIVDDFTEDIQIVEEEIATLADISYISQTERQFSCMWTLAPRK